MIIIPYKIHSNNIGPYIGVGKSVNPTNINCQLATVTLNVSGNGQISTTHNPIDVMLIIDRSGSMEGAKILAAKSAAKTFGTFLTDSDRAGLVSFETTAKLNQSLKFMDTANKIILNNTIDDLQVGDQTNIGDAILIANGELISSGRTSPVIWVEILLTDGQANQPFVNTAQDIEYAINASINASKENIIIYTIGLGSGADSATLIEIANNTGGKYYFAPDSSVLEQIYMDIAETLFNNAGTSIILDDILPPYVTLTSSLPSNCTYYIPNRTISCSLENMKINDSYILNFDVNVTMPGNNRVDVYPNSGVSYIDYLGSNTFASFPETNVTVTGYPGAAEICNDGLDNDCDKSIDCTDPDCAGQTGPGGAICCQVGSTCSESTAECDYLQRKYCTRNEFGTCSNNICTENPFVCGNADDTDYCANCNHCGDGECNCGETSMSCSEDCIELIPKVCVWGREIDVNGINIFGIRMGQYAFTGEQIKFNITVRDLKGAEDIGYVKLQIGEEQEVLCNPTYYYDGSCNGFGPFNNDTDRTFVCELTVEPQWYDETEIAIVVYDINNNPTVGGHKETWFFNPGISLDLETSDDQSIRFEKGGPGEIVHSLNRIIIRNVGEGGVNLWMYMAGTDFYGIGVAKCPTTNKIDIEDWMQFQAWSGTISGDWTYMSEYNENGVCSLSGTCYGGVPLPGDAPLDNILTNNGILEVQFKLEYPMPCIGKFGAASIIIIGKAI